MYLTEKGVLSVPRTFGEERAKVQGMIILYSTVGREQIALTHLSVAVAEGHTPPKAATYVQHASQRI